MTTSKIVPACLSGSALAQGQRKFVRVDGKDIVIFNVNGEVYAIDDSCPHSGASLFSGSLHGYYLTCPAHGLSFDIRTGCMRKGTGFNVRTYRCKLADDSIEIDQ